MCREWFPIGQFLNQISIYDPHGDTHPPRLLMSGAVSSHAPKKEECPMHNVFYLIGLIVVVLAIVSFVF